MRFHKIVDKNSNVKKVPFTKKENDARDAEEALEEEKQRGYAKKQEERAFKRSGVDLGGILCSATRDDQNGLAAVSVGVIMARGKGEKFPNTLFQFANGAELLITDANFDGYFNTWSTFRQGFFAPK